MKNIFILACLTALLALGSCNGWQEPAEKADAMPPIFPDYTEVTVPRNIAPLNFEIAGATHIQALLKAGNTEIKVCGERFIDIDTDDWRSLIDAALQAGGKIEVTASAWTEAHPNGVAYKPFCLYVSPDEVDRYVAYRLIPPSYELWCKMGIYQRDLESFDETAIIENTQNNTGCVNCHSFANYDATQGMMFHARGQGGGTIVSQHGQTEKIALEKIGPQLSGTYPMWHTSGNYIAFSSNSTRQSFYAHSRDKIEVYDQRSDLMIYDVKHKQVLTDERFTDSLNWETFPAFSPDGKYLYFCTAKAVKMPHEYNDLRYSIVRVPFDEKTGSLGPQTDTIYSASRQGGSVSFPRISPDGRYMLFTWADCATFPIHHKEADLKMIDLSAHGSGTLIDVSVLNSNDVDSYHSWGSQGKWVVLSSKRVDGRYTRLFLSHWDGKRFSKPMLLPQRDPQHNMQRMYSYNIPEFIKAPVDLNRDELADMFIVADMPE